MRRSASAFLALSLTFLGVTLFAQTPSPGTADETAIRAIVQKYVDAREAKDARSIEPLFTADADQLSRTAPVGRAGTNWCAACSNRRGRTRPGERSP